MLSMSRLKDEWIFYLKLSPDLPDHFLALDNELKNYGFSLLPVSLPNLVELLKTNENCPVLMVIPGRKQANYYVKHVSKYVKNLLRFDKIDLFVASSFEFINESSKISYRANYHFFPLPMKTKELCDKIVSSHLDRVVESKVWPGGKRPRISISK